MLSTPCRRTRGLARRLRSVTGTLVAAGLALALAPVLALPAAAAEEEEWRGVLRQQLLSQYGCRLDRFVFERQVPRGADHARDGRIQCADGREIDYTQPNILLKFELRLCQPTVC